MPQPKNPDTIILKNEYYPLGLNELQIWNHYQRYKDKILEQNKNRNVMLFILLEDGKTVVIKKKIGEVIKLTSSNYDNIISGRTISIHGLMRHSENIAIIDVDSNNFLKNKIATKEIYKFLFNKNTFIDECKIRYTGKNGFHIICYLNKNMNVDTIRTTFQKLLNASDISDKYTIKSKRTLDKVNIDLYRNSYNGGFISLYSLSIWGLQCMEVPFDKIDSFSQIQAKIK